MRALLLRLACLMALAVPLGGYLAGPALAADDLAEAQATIRLQEDAFRNDDAAAAFSYAAPLLQDAFQLPDLFMAMVKGNYAPVYRHKRFDFGDGETADGRIIQKVNIVDADGDFWEAVYTLERQSDGSLKITGCSLVKSMGA